VKISAASKTSLLSTEEAIPEAPIQILEEMSEQAMVATEAVYKHIRRNMNIQHVDLTHNNLS